MAENKNKIIVYRDWITTFDSLSSEEAGNLIQHFFRYVNDMNPEPPDRLTLLLFEPIKQTLKRDLKKYEAICLRNKDNGEKGGRPKQEPKKPSGLSGNPKNPDEPDSDSDSDSDTILKGWRGDYNIYLSECKEAYKLFVEDYDQIKKEQRLSPGVNIQLTIEKGFQKYWGTEAGWKNKKSKRTKDIDWKRTISNSIDSKMNRVYYTKEELAKC